MATAIKPSNPLRSPVWLPKLPIKHIRPNEIVIIPPINIFIFVFDSLEVVMGLRNINIITQGIEVPILTRKDRYMQLFIKNEKIPTGRTYREQPRVRLGLA
jgi:hypothetical protein